MKIDVEPTAEVIDRMAEHFRYVAQQLDRCAAGLRESGNLDYASEAANTVQNGFMNARLDLLVSRPVRALLTAKGG
jgi:hypothetical protein